MRDNLSSSTPVPNSEQRSAVTTLVFTILEPGCQIGHTAQAETTAAYDCRKTGIHLLDLRIQSFNHQVRLTV